MSYIDSHFHTQVMQEKGIDALALYDQIFKQGFIGGIDIGCTHNDLPQRASLLKDYPQILLSAAMGPWEAGKSETMGPDEDFKDEVIKEIPQLEAELAILKDNIIKYNSPFIGEIGLDYYWEYGNHEKQHLLFETQMQWANDMNKAVLIHDRDADEDTIDVIKRLGPSKGGIIHCFNGCEKLMDTALEHGYYISFAGNLTYKKNQNLRDLLKKVPKDRLLLETDAPYLTPVPFRGQFNSPAFIVHTYACASSVLEISVQEIEELVVQNFNNLVNS